MPSVQFAGARVPQRPSPVLQSWPSPIWRCFPTYLLQVTIIRRSVLQGLVQLVDVCQSNQQQLSLLRGGSESVAGRVAGRPGSKCSPDACSHAFLVVLQVPNLIPLVILQGVRAPQWRSSLHEPALGPVCQGCVVGIAIIPSAALPPTHPPLLP